MSAAAKTNPVGRPTKYTPSMCDQVIAWGEQGKSKTWMAASLGISKQRLYDWEQQYPEFRDALTRAMTLSQAWWEDQGQTGITADRFNASVWSRSMAARFPDEWRENKGLEITPPPDLRTPEQCDAEIRRLMAKVAPEFGFVPVLETQRK